MNIQFKTSHLTDVHFIHWTYGTTGAIGFTDGREDVFDEPGTAPPYDVAGKDLKVVFLHGRRTVDEEMTGWGFHGGDVKILGDLVRVGTDRIFINNQELPIVAGLVRVDAYSSQTLGVDEGFYGDFEIVQQKGN